MILTIAQPLPLLAAVSRGFKTNSSMSDSADDLPPLGIMELLPVFGMLMGEQSYKLWTVTKECRCLLQPSADVDVWLCRHLGSNSLCVRVPRRNGNAQQKSCSRLWLKGVRQESRGYRCLHRRIRLLLCPRSPAPPLPPRRFNAIWCVLTSALLLRGLTTTTTMMKMRMIRCLCFNSKHHLS